MHDWDIGDRASSIRVMGSGCKVELHPHSQHDYESWYFFEGEYNCDAFSASADPDSASWMRVWDEGEHHTCSVVLYDDCLHGHEVTFHEGDWGLHDWGIGERASSIRVMVSGGKVELHPHSEHEYEPWYFGELVLRFGHCGRSLSASPVRGFAAQSSSLSSSVPALLRH